MGTGPRAGKAEILLRIRNQVGQGLRTARRDLTNFAASTARIGGGALGAAGALGGGFAIAVRQFATFEQQIGRFNTVFGELRGEADAFAQTLAGRVNNSATAVRDSLSQFQAIARGQGFSASEAFDISKTLAEQTENLIAFDDTITNSQEAITRLAAVFTGETEPLRRYGADFRKTGEAVSSALAEIEASGSGFSGQQAETLARLNVFLGAASRGGITGQAEAEVGTLSAQFRGLRAAVDETVAAIGSTIGPSIASLTGQIRNAVLGIREFVQANPELVQRLAIAVPVIGAFGAALVAVGGVVATVGVAIAVITGLGSAISGLAAPAAVLIGLGAAAFVAYQNFEQLREGTNSVVNSLTTQFQQLGQDVAGVFDGIADAIAGGQLEVAGQIALKGLELAFELTLGRIRDHWYNFIDQIASVVLATGIFGGDLEGNLAALQDNQNQRNNSSQQRVAALRAELESLRNSATAAREKADADREAAQQARDRPDVEQVQRRQASIAGAAAQRSAGTFSGNIAQTVAPAQLRLLQDIKQQEEAQNTNLVDIKNAVEEAQPFTWGA